MKYRLALICILIFAIGLALTVAIDIHQGTYQIPEGSESLNIAYSLADHGTFANAYGNSGPSAHAAPLYPLLLSFLYKTLHIVNEQSRLNTATVVSTILASLHYALLPIFALAAGLRARVGIVAGLLGALLPVNHWMLTRGVFEYALTAFVALLFCTTCLYCIEQRRFTIGWGIGLGAISGLLLLTSPSFVFPIIALAVAGYYFKGHVASNSYLWFAAVQLFVAILFLMPWVVRNQHTFGQPIWARSNSGLELHLSNNDRATANWNGDLLLAIHPRLVRTERDRVTALGEIAYNREKMGEAITWITNHKLRFAELCMEPFGLFWFPQLKRPAQSAFLAAITICAFVGLFRLWKLGYTVARFFIVLWLSYAIPLMPFQTSARFSLPIAWSFLFAASMLLVPSVMARCEAQPEGRSAQKAW